MFVYGKRPGDQESWEDEYLKEVNHMLYWLCLLDKGLVSNEEFEEMCINDAF